MTRRVGVIIALGLLAVLAAGGFALSAHRPAGEVETSPSWGMYTTAQWQELERRYGPLTMRGGMPSLAVASTRSDCLLVLAVMRRVATVCRPTEPLRVFTVRGRGETDVAAVARRDVVEVVVTTHDGSSGSALLPAPHAWVIGSSFRERGPLTLTARDAAGHVVARVYCASALRGSCGMSAHRRS